MFPRENKVAKGKWKEDGKPQERKGCVGSLPQLHECYVEGRKIQAEIWSTIRHWREETHEAWARIILLSLSPGLHGRGAEGGRVTVRLVFTPQERDSPCPADVRLDVGLALANRTSVDQRWAGFSKCLFFLVLCNPDFCCEESLVWSPLVTERWDTGTQGHQGA